MTPTTLTRIDPEHPMLWRDADTVQFGLEGGLLIDAGEPWIEPLIQALRTGIRRSAFDVVAHGVGAPREAARRLLETLEPILVTDLPTPPPVWIESVDIDDSRVEARMEIALHDEGFSTAPRGTASTVGIVLVQGAASAHRLAGYLHDDLVHLPVAFEPGGVVIGPLIVPGRSPCLACRDAHERDRDPAWPAMHAQLIGAHCGRITTARTAEAAGFIARLLREIDAGPRSVRVSPDGRRTWREARFHADCRCREQSFRSLPGTATAGAPPALPFETTSARASARRA